jgi:hypothetical protein
MDITICTVFFDLNKYENRIEWRSKNNYLKWGEFVLAIPLNIIFIVEHEMYLYVWKKRKDYNLLEKTLIITKSIDQLKYYGILDSVKSMIDTNPITNIVNGKDSALYYILTWSRYFIVKELININPFCTQKFGWIDFGIRHIFQKEPMVDFLELFSDINDKIKILSIRPVLDEIYNTNNFRIACGLWTGSINYVNKMIDYFEVELEKLLEKKIAIHDEMLMANLFAKYNEIFIPYYGNYENIFDNYKITKIDNPIIFEYIKECRIKKYFELGLKIAIKIYDDCYDIMNITHKFLLLDETIICAYYIDKNIMTKFVSLFIDLIFNNNEMQKLFILTYDRIYYNFKYFYNIENHVLIQLDNIKNNNSH